jgi:ABC-2 type transport system permease protein
MSSTSSAMNQALKRSFWLTTARVKNMLRNIFLKTIRDRRRSFAYWALGLLLLAIVIEMFYPTVRDSQQAIQQFISKALPENLTAAFSYDINNFGTPIGFLNTEMFFFMVPMLVLIFAIGFGSDAVAGEEEKGTLDLLLSFPVPRWRLVAEKAVAMIVLTVVLVFVLWAGLSIGAGVVNMDISLSRLAGTCLSAALLGIDFGMFALALGGATGSRGLAIGVTGGLSVVSYFVNALSPVVDVIRHFQNLSLFYYYIGGEPLASGLNAGHIVIMIAVAAIILAAAIFGFRRRDVAA